VGPSENNLPSNMKQRQKIAVIIVVVLSIAVTVASTNIAIFSM
jgi:hypothetical protein